MSTTIEPIEPGTLCVWCWKEIIEGQPALKIKEGAHAHLACDSRMLNVIEELGGYLDA